MTEAAHTADAAIIQRRRRRAAGGGVDSAGGSFGKVEFIVGIATVPEPVQGAHFADKWSESLAGGPAMAGIVVHGASARSPAARARNISSMPAAGIGRE